MCADKLVSILNHVIKYFCLSHNFFQISRMSIKKLFDFLMFFCTSVGFCQIQINKILNIILSSKNQKNLKLSSSLDLALSIFLSLNHPLSLKDRADTIMYNHFPPPATTRNFLRTLELTYTQV